jgi:drug/metabolite transporter (DMT)-like permease
MPLSQPRWQVGFLLSLATAALWGMMPLVLKELLHQLDSPTIIWCRLLISAALVGAYYVSRRNVQWRPLLQPRMFMLLLAATAGLLGNYIFFMIGLAQTAPGAAQVLSQLAPLMLLVGGVVIFKEAFSPLQILGVIAVIVGLCLFFHHRFATVNLFDSYGIGLLWLLVAASSWAMFGLAQKVLTRKVNSQQVLLIIYAAGTVAYLPGAALSDIGKLSTLNAVLLVWASASMVFSYVTLGGAMQRWEASRVSAMLTTTPLFTLGYAAMLGYWVPAYIPADTLDLLSWLGAALVVVGSCVTALPRRRRA